MQPYLKRQRQQKVVEEAAAEPVYNQKRPVGVPQRPPALRRPQQIEQNKQRPIAPATHQTGDFRRPIPQADASPAQPPRVVRKSDNLWNPSIGGWRPHAGWGATGEGFSFENKPGQETPTEANLRIRRALHAERPDVHEDPDRVRRPDSGVTTAGQQQAAPAAPPPPSPLDNARSAFERSVENFKQQANRYAQGAQKEYRVQWGADGRPVVYTREPVEVSAGQFMPGEWTPDASQNWDSVWQGVSSGYQRVGQMPTDVAPYLDQYGGMTAQQLQQQAAGLTGMAAQHYQQAQGLIGQARQEFQSWDPITQTIRDADAYNAQRMGFDSPEAMQQWMAQARGARLSDMEGLTGDERQLLQQQLHSETQMMMDSHERAIDAIAGETGSTQQAFMASDQARRQIQDFRIQHQLGVLQADLQRRQLHFEDQKGQLQQMVAQGVMNQAQYMDWVHQDRALTMQSWAQNIAQTLGAQQQQMQAGQFALQASQAASQYGMQMAFGAFEQDRAAINDYIANQMSVINADLGMRAAIDAGMDQAYERQIRPFAAQIEAAMMQLSADTAYYEALFTEENMEKSHELAKAGIAQQKAASSGNTFLGILGLGIKLLTGGLLG